MYKNSIRVITAISWILQGRSYFLGPCLLKVSIANKPTRKNVRKW